MAVLVTGGAGYIGSHTCVELLNAGEDIKSQAEISDSMRTTAVTEKLLTGFSERTSSQR